MSKLVRGVQAAAFILAIPAAAPAPALAQSPASVLEIATDQSPVGLDPHVATSFATQLVTSTIYEGLTAIDPTCTSCRRSRNPGLSPTTGATYEFKLRAGAAFHNGRALTPADVVASVARVRDPKTGSPYASRFAAVSKVEADGRRRACASRSTSPPRRSWRSSPRWRSCRRRRRPNSRRQPVGTGPFKLPRMGARHLHRARPQPALLAAGPAAPRRPEVRHRAGGRDAAARHRERHLPHGAQPGRRHRGGAGGPAAVKVLQTQDLAYSLIGLNASKPPFDKPEVREAVNMALDRGQIVQAAYFGRAVAGRPALAGAEGLGAAGRAISPATAPIPRRAKTLLQQAGPDAAGQGHAQRAGQPAAGGRRRAGRAGADEQGRASTCS